MLTALIVVTALVPAWLLLIRYARALLIGKASVPKCPEVSDSVQCALADGHRGGHVNRNRTVFWPQTREVPPC